MTHKTDKIGIIGVGLMGHGIAANILRHGYPLVLLDHPGNQPVNDLIEQGATQVDTPALIARHADIIILCVTGTPQVQDVIYRDDGLLQHIKPGTIIIDCSTALPASTLQVAQDIQAAGALFLDAPMTRTPKEAANGRLNLLVGGDAALFERCKPLMQSYAEHITLVGPIGSGHRMKLIHNFVSLGFAAVLIEASACAQRAGVTPEVLMEILSSGGGDGVVLQRLRPFIESGDDSGFRFSLANALKDMTYYTTMAHEAGALHRTAEAIRQTYEHGHQAKPQGTVPELISVLIDDASMH
ncbi:NAD(P)-dependent oxidoreductase [Alcaligenaceae bacterium CGII-47]|nr:NAD(P)-dependent oxidoreductase [Alcaligenaceae bacterium CGII-47]